MVASRATTPEQYLSELPDDQRDAVVRVRDVILRNLPKGYHESMGYGMITYSIPLEQYPDTYNGQPLCFAALAAQKAYCAIYLMSVYGDPKATASLTAAFEKAGKKLDMGKSCVRFRSADDLALDAIARTIKATPPKAFIERYEASRATTPAARRAGAARKHKSEARRRR